MTSETRSAGVELPSGYLPRAVAFWTGFHFKRNLRKRAFKLWAALFVVLLLLLRYGANVSPDAMGRMIVLGAVPLLAHHGQDALARRLLPFVQRHLPAARLLNMGRVPLSDNYTFRQQGAVDIFSFHHTLDASLFLHIDRQAGFELQAHDIGKAGIARDALCLGVAALPA